MRALRGTRCFIVTATIAGLLAFAAPAMAAAPDAGLFGSSDPTYDGVYRQSLAILALEEAGATVPASAITWLKAQQCLDGRFMAYRASIRTACPAPDPEAFTGPDTNSTALAAMALEAVGEKAAAAKAVKSLVASQNPDGGWGYTFGSPSDANSTGLILAALDDTSDGEVASERKGLRYFRSIAGNCANGAAHLPYQAGQTANDLASAQALLGLNTGLVGFDSAAKYTKARKCTERIDQQVSEYLVDQLKKNDGLLKSPLDPTKPDFNATAWAIVGLVGANRPVADIAPAVRKLKEGASAYVGTGASTSPAAAATLALVAEHVDADARAFGGIDLVSTLKGSIRR